MDIFGYLKRIKKLDISAKWLSEGAAAGNYRSIFRSRGLDFREVREYTYGDDVRKIDWNVTSRMDNAYVKLFDEERELSLFFIVDVSPSMYLGSGHLRKSDVAVIIVALTAYSAMRNNDKIGELFFSDCIEHKKRPQKGRQTALALVNRLLDFVPAGKGSDISLALQVCNETLLKKSTCMIISDFRGKLAWRQLSYLNKKHDVIMVKIDDPLDSNFHSSSTVYLNDVESGKIIKAYRNSRAFNKKLNDFWFNQRYRWLRQCRSQNIETLIVNTLQDPVKPLHELFRRRRIGRSVTQRRRF